MEKNKKPKKNTEEFISKEAQKNVGEFVEKREVNFQSMNTYIDWKNSLISLQNQIKDSLSTTPQQKQEAQSKFQEYVNATGKQDIEGFKEFVSQPTKQTSEIETEGVVDSILTINTEPAENADEGISSNEGMEKLEEFYNGLTLPQKLSLQKAGIANLAELEKESKKDLYNNIDDFIDQLKQCF
jgi:hypothetical protein